MRDPKLVRIKSPLSNSCWKCLQGLEDCSTIARTPFLEHPHSNFLMNLEILWISGPKSPKWLCNLDGPTRANRFADSREWPDSRESFQGSRTEWTASGGLTIANRKFEAIRANRSHIMKIFFSQRVDSQKKNRANRPDSPCESPGHLSPRFGKIEVAMVWKFHTEPSQDKSIRNQSCRTSDRAKQQ